MSFCLPKELANKMKVAIKSGKVQPEKLAGMTSKERNDFFTEIVGKDESSGINALFESKLLLKNQQQGMINWAKQITGIKPEVRRDIIARIEKMDKVLDPKDADLFLEDLASRRLGTDVTFEEAKTISDYSKEVTATKSAIELDSPLGSESRMAYGRAVVRLSNYVNDLKLKNTDTLLEQAKNAPGKAALEGISKLGGLAKSMKASLDNSVIGRQGLKTLFSNPKIWRKNSLQTFKDMIEQLGGKNVRDEVVAEVLSRPNALNGLYAKEKLAVGNIEEAYPTSLPERIPGLGRAFKASQAAFEGFQYRTRADVFDKYVEIAEKTGADISGIGKVANALTGRGSVGGLEPVATHLNNIFFSPRFLKSNIDLLTVHAFDKGIGSFARKQAAKNMVKTLGGIGTVLTIANAVDPGSVELDPRSSDFGKIKVGDTRFDVAGGMSSLVTLASRLGTMSSKSTTSGKVYPLNSGDFGSRTGVDVALDFITGKFAPLPAVVRDYLKGENFQGDKPTLKSSAVNLFAPLPITNYIEAAKNPEAAPAILRIILDGLGIGANTYSPK
jgi:hypothetical protein